MRGLLTIACVLCIYSALAQYPNAHAHNDYEHSSPLFDALDHGFTSVEVDVHLANDELWVTHNRPTSSSKSLEALYLKPISKLIADKGALFPDYAGDFYLMIDIKTDADKTYMAIESLLRSYVHIIDKPLDKSDDDHPLKVFLSGNRPIKAILNSQNPPVAIDGRPDELEQDIPALLMPVISQRFSQYNPFKPLGKIDPEKEMELQSYINAVHAEGKKVRFWAHPDDPETWEYLLSLGVDLINSDKLHELDVFLTEKEP